MLACMGLLLDSFWRAIAYCLQPRVIGWSLFPLALMGFMVWVLGYFFWSDAITWTEQLLQGAGWLARVWEWLQGHGVQSLPSVIAPVLVVLTVTPVIIVICLLLVSVGMTPALVKLVAQRRFSSLEKKHGGTALASLIWSLGSTLIAIVALLVSMPLWFVPPLLVIIPPLIWGWLTYRVMAFDALAEHGSKAERRELFRRNRTSLLMMGVVCGYMGAAPTMVWASGVVFIAAFWLLIPLAIWIYALVFAFSSLWFSHYCLAALQRLREEGPQEPVEPSVPYSPDVPRGPYGEVQPAALSAAPPASGHAV